MRISDWSSDVCSSDLLTRTISRSLSSEEQVTNKSDLKLEDTRRNLDFRVWKTSTVSLAEQTLSQRLRTKRSSGSPRKKPHGDRKSVVKGKSVSVRVDLGGRSIIKKKKKENKTL